MATLLEMGTQVQPTPDLSVADQLAPGAEAGFMAGAETLVSEAEAITSGAVEGLAAVACGETTVAVDLSSTEAKPQTPAIVLSGKMGSLVTNFTRNPGRLPRAKKKASMLAGSSGS